MSFTQNTHVDNVLYRTNEINILKNILLRSNKFLYPLIYIYGLSGTGKTFLIKNFLNYIKSNNDDDENRKSNNYSIYLNCVELCNSQCDQLFNEIADEFEKQFNLNETTKSTTNINSASNLLKFLTTNLKSEYINSNLLIVIDHLNYLNVSSKNDFHKFFLFLTKLNDYLANSTFNSVTIVLISEYDWHSFLYDFDLVSNTELQKPFCIHFSDYTKEQMASILSQQNDITNKNFYMRIILDVFFSICKDLNELNYITETYYNHLCDSMKMTSDNHNENTTITMWNKMKPFLKQALTKIYLRESFLISSNTTNSNDLTKQFESLNITVSNLAVPSQNDKDFVDLPLYAKYLLISAYIATHNASKYDKKLFDYGETKSNARKIRYTSNYYQKADDLRHSAILQLQQFDLNRLLGIFYSLIFSQNLNLKTFNNINLNSILSMIQMLKNFNFIQQLNSSYSSLDEPKYKCLIDFDTIQTISNSVKLNIKQYLCEYFL